MFSNIINMVKKELSLFQIWSNNEKNNDNTFNQHLQESIFIEYCYLNNFDWEKYLLNYPDLKDTIEDINEFTLYKHWIEIGKNENRCAGKKFSQEPYDCFDYKSYSENNPDLISITDHLELYNHWCNNGIYENRIVTNIETISNSSTTVEDILIQKMVNIFKIDEINELWVNTLNTLKEEFDWKFYVNFYKDEFLNANIISYSQSFYHWIMHGKEEGRICKKKERLVKKKINENNEQKKQEEIQETENKDNESLIEIPIFIINLKERIDKKIEIIHQMNELNISNYEFFEAWDKTKDIVTSKFKEYVDGYDKGTIKRTIYNSNWKTKVIKSVGAIGLIASTIELFKIIESKGLDNVIILEDDVQLHKSWIYMLKPLKTILKDIDLLYIGYNNHKKHINELLVGCNTCITKDIPCDGTLSAFYGTFGYICTSRFRKKIIDLGIDWFIQNNATIDYGYNILTWDEEIISHVVTGEPLVFPDVFDPDCINNKRENKEKFYLDRFIKCENYISKPESDIQFVFIVPSYNNEKWIERNIMSMICQTYHNWRLIYLNDNSTDNTHRKYNELYLPIKDKSVYIHNDIKYGQAFNRYRAYNMCEDNEYCIMLDGDDWLPHKYVLQYLSIFIKMYDLDLTYGRFNWFLDNKIQKYNFPKDYTEKVISELAYRKDSWRAMHLRVIKAQHLKFINALDFIQDNGEFIICCTDLVESFAGLELCKGRHKMTDEILMIYNKDNSVNYSTSHYNDSNKELKQQIQRKVRGQKPYFSNIRNDSVVILDIEDSKYKELINNYKQHYYNKADLFLVKGSELHFYINKINTYNNIQYMT